MSFSETLRAARKKKGLSMIAVAALTGIAAPIYRMIENDKIHPDRDKLDVLCKALDISWSDNNNDEGAQDS